MWIQSLLGNTRFILAAAKDLKIRTRRVALPTRASTGACTAVVTHDSFLLRVALSCRMIFTECLPHECPAGDACSNNRIQRQECVPGLEKFHTGDRGYGVKTTLPVNEGKDYYYTESDKEWVKSRLFMHQSFFMFRSIHGGVHW